jgi:hypothetical protein
MIRMSKESLWEEELDSFIISVELILNIPLLLRDWREVELWRLLLVCIGDILSLFLRDDIFELLSCVELS